MGLVVRGDVPAASATTLLRMVALYMGTVAAALLAFLYFATTRLVVTPILELSLAARRVAEGARSLPLSPHGARGFVDLAFSLDRMTTRLRADEEALRGKISEVARYARDLAAAQNDLVRSERLASVGRLAAGLAHEPAIPSLRYWVFRSFFSEGGFLRAKNATFWCGCTGRPSGFMPFCGICSCSRVPPRWALRRHVPACALVRQSQLSPTRLVRLCH